MGDVLPTPKAQLFYGAPHLVIAGDADSGIRRVGPVFKLADRLTHQEFVLANDVANNIPPVHVPNALNGHGALAFGGISVGGGQSATNGALEGVQSLDLSTPFSLVMIGHGNGSDEIIEGETSGVLLSVGAHGKCFGMRHTTNGDYQAVATDYEAAGVEAVNSVSKDYGPTDMVIVVASFDPLAGKMTINVNGTDVVSREGVTNQVEDGPFRFGHVKDDGGGIMWPSREQRLVQYAFFACDLHEPINAESLQRTLDYYREVAGL
ncbi:hypothetical protein [Sulfitobacter geojensis]|uniref:hypothetical protein n=1 Tax=Sulfitobacter geojensis TaxID=1342299 RepID=UPI003B8DDB98